MILDVLNLHSWLNVSVYTLISLTGEIPLFHKVSLQLFKYDNVNTPGYLSS